MNFRLRRAFAQVAVPILAAVCALVVGALVIGLQGQNPVEVYRLLLHGALVDPIGFGQVIFKTTTLAFTGLAAALAFRAGLFNIGGEGQIYVGAFAAALVGVALPAGTPSFVALPLLVLVAFSGGAIAALIPAALKALRGTHEVITMMMMSFVLLAVVNYLLGLVRLPETVRTAEVVAGARLLRFSKIWPALRGSDGNASAFVALACAGVVSYLLARTRWGFELRAVGLGPGAAEAAGISVASRSAAALVASGGIAGLGGINFVLGSPGYFEQSFAPNQGYLGIAVALVARNRPLAVIPAAFFFSVLSEGAQAIQSLAPREVGDILQGLVILFVVLGARLAEQLRVGVR